MLSTAAPSGVSSVLEVVTATPGLTRAAAARALHCRRAVALELITQALEADLIHEDDSAVAIRAGATRTVTGLYPGPAARALFAEPALSGERLRQTRLRAGLAVGVLAEHLEVSPAQLRRWETGQQTVPVRVRARVPGAVEAAQAAQAAQLAHSVTRPRRRRDVRRYQDLLRQIAEDPGRSRWALVRTRSVDARLLEHALATGQAHEAPTWSSARNRQAVVGVFPGPALQRRPDSPVRVADLAAARDSAGWSQDRIAERLGVARPTWARWERELEVVPGWAATAAADALAAARAARRDDQAVVLAAITAQPGLSRKALLATLGFSRSSPTHVRIDALIAAGAAHERHADKRGQRSGIYPGLAAAEVLTGARLRELRTRAGLKQRDLAAQVGTHVQAVRDWEGGHRVLSPDWQRRLLEHLEAQPARAVDAHEQLLEDLETAIAEQPRPLHQLHELRLASHGLTDAALAELTAAGRAHQGRLAAPPSVDRRGRTPRGRMGYMPGPGPA